jgi:hypothetical protein
MTWNLYVFRRLKIQSWEAKQVTSVVHGLPLEVHCFQQGREEFITLVEPKCSPQVSDPMPNLDISFLKDLLKFIVHLRLLPWGSHNKGFALFNFPSCRASHPHNLGRRVHTSFCNFPSLLPPFLSQEVLEHISKGWDGAYKAKHEHLCDCMSPDYHSWAKW